MFIKSLVSHLSTESVLKFRQLFLSIFGLKCRYRT